ncbi:high-affinity lysophosphatidic acid receptor-like [Branchiostoma floridae x Branchiostoma japonicum]
MDTSREQPFVNCTICNVSNWNGTNNITDAPSPNDEEITTLSPSLVVLLSFLMILMILITVLGNSVVCLIVFQKPVMRSAINLLLANMAAADIMVGVLSMPFTLIALIAGDWLLGTVFCQVHAFLYTICVMEGILILVTISVDRYMIIVRRKDKLNTTRAKVLIAVTWIFSIVVSFPPFVGWGHLRYLPGQAQCRLVSAGPADTVYSLLLVLVQFFFPFFAMLYSFMRIISTVRKNSMRIMNQPECLAVTQSNRLGLQMVQARARKLNVDMSFKTRAFTTIFVLFIIYVMCWAPYAIVEVIHASWINTKEVRGMVTFDSIVLWISYLNSAINPMVYCWRIKKFREAVRELMPSLKFLPRLPGRVHRRIRPGAMYECNASETSTV